MAAILYFFVGARSWSQFCSGFIQNWWGGRKLSSAVCYSKSARSVGNFHQYGEPRFRKKIKMAAKNFFGNKASEVSISTEIDLLITNMIIFSRFDASFPLKVAKNVKIEKKVKWLNILTLPWAILLYFNPRVINGTADWNFIWF